MGNQFGVIKITTLNPAKPGLNIRIVRREEGSEVEGETLFSGVLDSGGSWHKKYTNIDENTLVTMVLHEDDGTELVRWRGILRTLNPMECFMTNPVKRSEAELHKRWRQKYREMKASGVKHPDPDAVARAAFVDL